MHDELGELYVRKMLDASQTGLLLRQRFAFLHGDDSTLLAIGVMNFDAVQVVQRCDCPIEQSRISDNEDSAVVLHVGQRFHSWGSEPSDLSLHSFVRITIMHGRLAHGDLNISRPGCESQR
jgi:hypothetical protein